MILEASDYKIYTDIEDDEHDDLIEILIKASEAWIANYCQNHIEKPGGNECIIEHFNGGDLKENIYLANTLNIANLTLKELKGGEWVSIPENDYELHVKEGRIELAKAVDGKNNYRVEYKAGFDKSDIPEDLKLTILLLANALWNKRKSGGIGSESFAEISINWDRIITKEMKLFLDCYKKISI